MARVPVDVEIRTRAGAVVPTTRLYIYDRDTTNQVSVYTAATGGSVITQPLLADAEGRFPDSWVEAGSYDRYSPDDTVEPTQPWEAVVGIDSGTLAVISEAPINVTAPQWGGAVLDGTGDVTEKLQDVLDLVPTFPNPTAEILIPRGIGQVTNLVSPRFVRLIGEGQHVSVLRRVAGSSGIMFTDDGNATGIQLQGLTLDGGGLGTDVVKLGYGATANWNYKAGMRDMILKGSGTGYGADLKADVAYLDEVHIDSNAKGLRTAGTSFRVGSLYLVSNPGRVIDWGAAYSHIRSIHIEQSTATEPIAIDVTGTYNNFDAVYYNQFGTTLTTLMQFATASYGNQIGNLTRVESGSTLTNYVDWTSTETITGVEVDVGTRKLEDWSQRRPPSAGFSNWQPATATSGTDTAFANGTQFVTSLQLPVNKVITAILYLVGSVGGTDKVYAVLYDAYGSVLANSSLTSGGATVGTAAQLQQLNLTTAYAARGPKLYYIGISANGATAKLRTVPAWVGAGLYAGTVAQTHGTVAAITEPVSTTANTAPVAYVY